MRILVIFLTMGSITACISSEYSARLANIDATGIAVPTEPQSCSSALAGDEQAPHRELDSSEIQLVNWNIQKGGDPQWTTDLTTLTGEADLMVLQEAAMNTAAWELVADDHYRSFAPGHRTWRAITGVMTLSSAEPLAQCNLVSLEPWLRSPKATVITEYGLSDTDHTLLVVNIHAINFTFGTSDHDEQIRRALAAVKGHDGPILMSGDFNTWHWRQSEGLQTKLEALGFVALDYDEDHRKRAFGQPLDHIYVRGLSAIEATTSRVDSSDHNPMSVKLRVDLDPMLSVSDVTTLGGF